MKMAEMRDLKADLELCNKATPGPWLETDKSNLEVFVENTWGEPVLYELQYDGPHTAIKQEDMEFMIAAREGWPHAIERAMRAETLLRDILPMAMWESCMYKDHENNAEKWLEQGVVELERAIKAERLKDMLVKYNKFLVAEVLNKRERSEQLESLVRELAEALQLYENWEAKVIMDDSLWQSASGLPFITQEVWDELVAIQTERNKVLYKAKEVLGK
jgi:hypothetical protein